MDRMIQDLLDVSRIEAGHLSIETTVIDCTAAVQDACDMLEPIARKNDIRLACVLASPLPAVRADRDRLVQVLSNLVGNAIKFSDPGGLVEIAAEDGGDEVRFAVRDQGPGITPENLRHIFEPFWQGDDATAPQGAGIGLTIARGIVEAHGGQLTCESEPGGGTTFHFTLPTPASAAAE
jgi:signal transduction histidine kinase